MFLDIILTWEPLSPQSKYSEVAAVQQRPKQQSQSKWTIWRGDEVSVTSNMQKIVKTSKTAFT